MAGNIPTLGETRTPNARVSVNTRGRLYSKQAEIRARAAIPNASLAMMERYGKALGDNQYRGWADLQQQEQRQRDRLNRLSDATAKTDATIEDSENAEWLDNVIKERGLDLSNPDDLAEAHSLYDDRIADASNDAVTPEGKNVIDNLRKLRAAKVHDAIDAMSEDSRILKAGESIRRLSNILNQTVRDEPSMLPEALAESDDTVADYDLPETMATELQAASRAELVKTAFWQSLRDGDIDTASHILNSGNYNADISPGIAGQMSAALKTAAESEETKLKAGVDTYQKNNYNQMDFALMTDPRVVTDPMLDAATKSGAISEQHNRTLRVRRDQMMASIDKAEAELDVGLGIISGTVLFNANDKDQRRMVDMAYNHTVMNMSKSGATPDDIYKYTLEVAKTGYVPTAVVADIKMGVSRGDGESLLKSATLWSTLKSVNPVFVSEKFSDSEKEKMTLLLDRVENGVPLSRAMGEIKEVFDTPADIRKKKADEVYQQFESEQGQAWLDSVLTEMIAGDPGFFNSLGVAMSGNRPLTPAEKQEIWGVPILPDLHVYAWNTFFEERYQLDTTPPLEMKEDAKDFFYEGLARFHGNEGAAQRWMSSKLAEKWAPSPEGDFITFRAHAPYKYHATPDKGGKWIREDFDKQISGLEGVEDPKDWMPVAHPRTPHDLTWLVVRRPKVETRFYMPWDDPQMELNAYEFLIDTNTQEPLVINFNYHESDAGKRDLEDMERVREAGSKKWTTEAMKEAGYFLSLDERMTGRANLPPLILPAQSEAAARIVGDAAK